MARWLRRRWEPNFDAGTRAGRRAGTFDAYLPDPLSTRPLLLDNELSSRAAAVEASIHDVTIGPEMRVLEGLSRFMLRSEAIASSRIEGMQASAAQIALAELAPTDAPQARGFTRNALLIANNITALRKATTDLADAPAVCVEGIDELHRSLLPDERHHGLRTVQNWIGGNDWHPIDADFMPPPPEFVPELMADLVRYLNGGLHAPLVQAALVHAQFETIHPYTDGNGRVGRALIHTVLTRRGLTPSAVLPISPVLLTRSADYLTGLTSYRYEGPADGPLARDGFARWLETFLTATELAVEQVTRFMTELARLRTEWWAGLARYRQHRGLTPGPRASSTTARLLELLPEAPLVTARTVQRLLGVSFPAARAAAEELAEAGILARKSVERATTGYFARDVFDLLTYAERRPAGHQPRQEEVAASPPGAGCAPAAVSPRPRNV